MDNVAILDQGKILIVMKEEYRESLNTVLSKCSICLENLEISSEELIKKYISFLSDTFLGEHHHTDIVLHAETTCFDVISISCAALSCVLLDENSQDDIISQLAIGEKVEYTLKKKRFIYNGMSSEYGPEYIELQTEDKKETQWVPRKNWSFIKPYHGQATTSDGRGIRRNSGLREVFYRKVLNIKTKEIPSLIQTSVIIIMAPERARYYVENISFKIENNNIPLLDLVTASYYSEKMEVRFRGNSGKNDPVIKFTNKASNARSLIYNKEGNRNIGILVLGQDNYRKNYTELPALISRRRLQYSLVSMRIDDIYGTEIISQYEGSELFVCSKDYLLSIPLNSDENNKYVSSLNKAIDHIIDHELIKVEAKTDFADSEYYRFKKMMAQICKIVKDSADNNTKTFIKQAYSMMKVFISAPFSMTEMKTINDSLKTNISSPVDRLNSLMELVINVSPLILDIAKQILEILSNAYNVYSSDSGKKNALLELLSQFDKEKIAIIVPYEYFGAIIKNMLFRSDPSYIRDGKLKPFSSRIDISTPAGFDNRKNYDVILVTSLLSGTSFNIFRNYSAEKIYVILYSFENSMFRIRKKAADLQEKQINERSSQIIETDEPVVEYNYSSETLEEEKENDRTIDDFIEKMNSMIQFNDILINGSKNSNAGKKAVTVRSASFESEEIAFFTKNYKAYVLDSVKEEVIEKSVEDLENGDILLFTRSNENTRDIVDVILQKMIENDKVSDEIKLSYERSLRWKNDLKRYKKDNYFSTTDVVKRLSKLDTGVGEMAIRNWLDPDSHIVRPRSDKSLLAVAKLTGDSFLEKDLQIYIKACDDISSIRRNIQKEIGKAIVVKYSGKNIEQNSLVAEINDRLNDLAQLLRIETIVDIKQEIPMNYINRPIYQ